MKIFLIGLVVAFVVIGIAIFYFTSGMKKGYRVEQDKVLFYEWNAADGQKVHVLPLNSETFKSIDDRYAMDDKKVFFLDRVIEGADPKTFQKIEVNKKHAEDVYCRDQAAVYIRGKKFELVDVSTFEVVGHGYTKDKGAVYYDRKLVDGADPTTFEMIVDKNDEYNIRFKDLKNEYDRLGKRINP